MFQNCGSFQAVFFFFADLRKIKAFNQMKTLFFCFESAEEKNRPKELLKRTAFLGHVNCKPAKCVSKKKKTFESEQLQADIINVCQIL